MKDPDGAARTHAVREIGSLSIRCIFVSVGSLASGQEDGAEQVAPPKIDRVVPKQATIGDQVRGHVAGPF